MTRLMLKRFTIFMMTSLLTLLVWGCAETTTVTTTGGPTNLLTPALSQPNAIFYQGSNYAITYGDVFEEFKINDGIAQLLNYVDQDLLSEYITAVTPLEIADRIDLMTYGTTDDAEIAALENPQDYIDDYEENLFLLGFQDEEEAYIRLILAKEKYTVAAMSDPANNTKSWYVTDEKIATHYENIYFPDATAIKIRFYDEIDAKRVMDHFNLIHYGDNTIRLYFGTTPVDKVPSYNFNNTNTRALTNAELLSYFIQMYNYVYGGFKPLLNPASTVDDLKANPDLQVSFDDLNISNAGLGNFVFNTLSDYESFSAGTATTRCYSDIPRKFNAASDNSHYLILKVSQPAKAEFSTIVGTDLYNTLRQTLVDTELETDNFYAMRMVDLREAHGFEIFDYYMGVDYQMADTDFELTTTGHATLIAKYDDIEITADQLLTYALGRNAALYSLYAAQSIVSKALYFPTVYCADNLENCELDVALNTSAKITEHEQKLADLQVSFEESYYAQYYTFAEYLYLAYGAKSNADMIEKYYVKSTLQPYLIYDELKSDNWGLLTDYLYDLIQDYYDNYFSLKVKTLTISLDRNEDGIADNYDEFVDGLTDEAAYNTLLANFETAIRTYMEDTTDATFTKLVLAYRSASREDSIWKDFKNYGFILSTTDLSSSDSLTYLSTQGQYEDLLIDGFIAAYTEYSLPANSTESLHLYSTTVKTTTGMVFLECQKGANFTKPSAKFAETNPASPVYSVGAENISDLPSVDQLKLYCEYRFDQIVYGTGSDVETKYGIVVPKLPASLVTAMEAYFNELHDSMYVVGFLNIIVADKMQTGNFTNLVPSYSSTENAVLKAQLLAIKDVYFGQVFSDFDTIG